MPVDRYSSFDTATAKEKELLSLKSSMPTRSDSWKFAQTFEAFIAVPQPTWHASCDSFWLETQFLHAGTYQTPAEQDTFLGQSFTSYLCFPSRRLQAFHMYAVSYAGSCEVKAWIQPGCLMQTEQLVSAFEPDSPWWTNEFHPGIQVNSCPELMQVVGSVVPQKVLNLFFCDWNNQEFSDDLRRTWW